MVYFTFLIAESLPCGSCDVKVAEQIWFDISCSLAEILRSRISNSCGTLSSILRG